jgi:uncharacterized membrane protein HdeD (DUF308 family)
MAKTPLQVSRARPRLADLAGLAAVAASSFAVAFDHAGDRRWWAWLGLGVLSLLAGYGAHFWPTDTRR